MAVQFQQPRPLDLDLSESVRSLGNAFAEARARERQKKQDEFNRYMQLMRLKEEQDAQKRIAVRDRANAIVSAMKAGGPEAALIIQGAGGQLTGSQDAYEANPNFKPSAQTQGGSAVPDQNDGGRKLMDAASAVFGVAMPMPAQEDTINPLLQKQLDRSALSDEFEQRMATGGAQEQVVSADSTPVSARSTNPLILARYRELGAKMPDINDPGDALFKMSPQFDPAQRMVGQRQTFRFDDGQQFTIDPLAQRKNAKALASRIKGTFGAEYDEYAQGLARAGYSEQEILKDISQRKAEDAREAAREAAADRRLSEKIDAENRAQDRFVKNQPYYLARSTAGMRGAEGAEIDVKSRALALEKQFQDVAKEAATAQGGTALVKDYQKLLTMATQVAGASDNAALASIVAGSFTKFAQGGTGVISDSDLAFFWQKVGGLGIRTAQQLYDIYDGSLGPEKQKIVREAVGTLLRANYSIQASVGDSVVNSMTQLGATPSQVYRGLKTHVPYYAEQWRREQEKEGAVIGKVPSAAIISRDRTTNKPSPTPAPQAKKSVDDWMKLRSTP